MRLHAALGLGLAVIGMACAGFPGLDGTEAPAPGPPGETREATPAGPTTDKATKKSSRDGGRADTPPPGVTAMGGDRWQVERRLVRKWQDKPERLALASQKGGGFMLKKVSRKDARFLGFENRDILTSVNGKPLGSPAEAAAAYAAVKGADTLTVRFKRRGATRTHTYQIVD